MLKADGKTEKEIFVNYGKDYEHVRIREGYSKLPLKRQQVVLGRADKHQREFVLDVLGYEAPSLAACVKFFSTKLLPEHYYGEGGQGIHIDPELRDRALQMSRMFRIRAGRIIETVAKNKEMAGESQDSSDVERYDPSGGIDMEQLMTQITALIERLSLLSCSRPIQPYSKEMEMKDIAEAETYHEKEGNDSLDGDILDLSDIDSDDNGDADDDDDDYDDDDADDSDDSSYEE